MMLPDTPEPQSVPSVTDNTIAPSFEDFAMLDTASIVQVGTSEGAIALAAILILLLCAYVYFGWSLARL